MLPEHLLAEDVQERNLYDRAARPSVIFFLLKKTKFTSTTLKTVREREKMIRHINLLISIEMS
jgi:hypothetical protein